MPREQSGPNLPPLSHQSRSASGAQAPARRPTRTRNSTQNTDEKLRILEQAQRDSEAQIHAILDTAVDAIITIDERGRMESFNRAAQKLFGFAPSEVIGQNVKMLMPEPYQREHDVYLANYIRTGKAKIIGIGRGVIGMRKDGSVFPMELAVSEVRLGDRVTFTGIVRDITERRQLERDVLEISEREQRRIGQDLHDGLCQQLTGIAFLVQAMQQKLAMAGRYDADQFNQITLLLKEAVTQARNLSHGLYPVDPQPDGLMVALRELCTTVSAMFNITCTFRCRTPVMVNDNSVATHLYRIAQEALHNAIRHGKASRISIELNLRQHAIRLIISDNGVGFPPAEQLRSGMGLRTMAHRAQVVGATIDIRRPRSGGSQIVCKIAKER
jgi:two-component system, LuxR family, sensor kinase FixL